MKLTSIFRLRKPEGTDPVNVEDFNDNFDVIDAELNKRPEKTGNASDMVTTFSQASSRTNLTPGEKISISFGKIMKWFVDLKTVAFSGKYPDLTERPALGGASSLAVANNCTTTAAGSVLDARQGKVLMDKSNQLNRDFEAKLPNGVKLITEGSGANVKYYAQLGADAASKKLLGSNTVVTMLQHQSCDTVNTYYYIPTTNLAGLPTLAQSGYIINIDTGAFTMQNSNEFRCNRSGTLYLIGVGSATGGTPTYAVFKNGVEIVMANNYGHSSNAYAVSAGDVIKIGSKNKERYTNIATLAMIL